MARSRVSQLFVGVVAALAIGVMPVPVSAQTTARPAAQTPAAKAPTRASLARAAAAARARRAAAARAAAAAALKQAMTPQFKLDLLGNRVPDVRAAAAIVYNPTTGDVLWEENSHAQRSIASLTKIMTAVTFIADDPNLARRVTVIAADTRAASVTYLRAGETIALRDVLNLALIASDNAAARVLARTSEGGTPAFIRRMNDMASHLGLTSTRYADPSGLDARNVSSAYDISHLISFATSDERLGPIMRSASARVATNRRTFTINNTNKLLGTDVDVVGGKTGFISKAGYCLATLLQIPQGTEVAVVVLGATSSAIRFWETRHLFNWAVSRTQSLLADAASVVPVAAQP